VAGTVGGEIRREQMTEAAGGDTHAAYQEMSAHRHGHHHKHGGS
jgi:hypothetical protein